MDALAKLFEDTNAKPKDFLQRLDSLGLAGADTEALRAILGRRWDELQIEPAGGSADDLRKWKAARGYAFELMVFKLLALEGLEPSPSYYAHPMGRGEDEPEAPRRRGRRPGGEQIDGCFVLDGRYFLVEAKWQEPIAASDMYVFRGRVDGKLVGTVGVLVSATGFAKDAEFALFWGKEVNVLLVDGNDVGLALESGNSFRAMMKVKLREAASVGRVFYSYAEFLDSRKT
jgi:hypothetical protein